MNKELNRDRLRYLFDYDDATGELVRKVSVRGGGEHFKGGRPKHRAVHGYWALGVDGRRHLYHRLVWAWHYGHPDGVIDHIDGDKSNNRIENLRLCTQSENLCNSRTHRDSLSGVKGVSRAYRPGKWRARVGLRGRQFHLGTFDNVEEADVAVRRFRERLHGEYHNHGGDTSCQP